MEVNGQLHVSAALPPNKSPPLSYPINIGLAEPGDIVGAWDRRKIKNILPLTGFKPLSLAVNYNNYAVPV
jgi:hypothetical protein